LLLYCYYQQSSYNQYLNWISYKVFCRYFMSDPLRMPRLVFNSRRINNERTPDDMLKSIWVSTALALVLSLPSLGIFLGLLCLTNNIIVSSLSGFTIHFILLALSPRLSQALLSLFDQPVPDQVRLFWESDNKMRYLDYLFNRSNHHLCSNATRRIYDFNLLYTV
jgi:hypothetical protein